ncbi:hypothetical protein VD659_17655 [Herbiconiux sp. 11R-BC]|uniref:hypothetical protein n=1 Tax=Herbiconiux sp. 11R-BC TaxID=3111637 RepID=UPI003C0A4660
MAEFVCVFCELPGERSKEHILRDKFNGLIPTFDRILLDRTVGGVRQPRQSIPLSPFMLTVNQVCKACNNGWLNDLEEEVEDLIVGLALAKTISVPIARRPRLALWMATRALLRTLQEPADGRAPRVLFNQAFRTQMSPETVFAHLAVSDEYAFPAGRCSWASIEPSTSAQNSSRPPHTSYFALVSFGIQALFFQVAIAGGSKLTTAKAAQTLDLVQRELPSRFVYVSPAIPGAMTGYLTAGQAVRSTGAYYRALGLAEPRLNPPGEVFRRL